MRLRPDLYLVGGGHAGFDLSAPLDCHVYLLDGGDELALVDAGLGIDGGVDDILANVEAELSFDGTTPDPVGRLVEPDEGYGYDAEPDSVAYDAGAAGGGASAEELAMHEVRER